GEARDQQVMIKSIHRDGVEPLLRHHFYTIRGSALRVISLRKANKREVNNYVKQTQDRNAD
ncbi:MAG: Ribonuclease toxin, BrnT, of type toxin-antitoxin system, partial [Blastocatellia bacterium]|nr:Ribonuclease toxin, BrnT, of type toxin-antitoxin system [Blastocatellia bacterium]